MGNGRRMRRGGKRSFRGFDAQIEHNIREHGWHATGVYPSQEEYEAGMFPFVYSIGLAERGLNEYLTIGDPKQMHFMLRNAIDYTFDQDRELPLGRVSGGLILNEQDAWLVQLSEDAMREYPLGVRRRCADGACRQIVWPDRDGYFPWDAEYTTEPAYRMQVVLGEVV